MGRLAFLFFWLLFGSAYAQVLSESNNFEIIHYNQSAISIKDTAKAELEAINWLKKQIKFQNYVLKLKTISKQSTALSTFYRFQIEINTLPIYGGQILVKCNSKTKKIKSISASNFLFQSIDESIGEATEYLLINKKLLPVKRTASNTLNMVNSTYRLIYQTKDLNGETAIEVNNNTKKSDTTIQAKVFYPEPITSAKTSYGAPYLDDSDKINTSLLAEHYFKSLPLTFRDDTFRLENEYFIISEHSLPTEPVWKGVKDSLIFNRSEMYFEQVNIFYHLSHWRQHLDSLGYSTLGKKQVEIDAHGFSGADMSSYSSTSGTPRLTFGQGGIDDGEDPGIIVHEYSHALSDFAAPKSNLGKERNAIDEGIADYFAISYNRKISEYRYTDIFKWDGHNEFWNGRKINPNQHYPEDLVGTIHNMGGLFTVILVDLSNKIGQNNTDKLALEVMFDFMPSLTFQELGKLLVKTEKALFNEKYKREVCDVLWTHGLVNPCYVGIEENTSSIVKPVVLNSYEFAKRNGNLTIVLPTKNDSKFEVINSTGKVFNTGESSESTIELSPNEFGSGIYFIRFPESKFEVVKVVVF